MKWLAGRALTHRGPPPGVRDGGEVGVVDVVLHRVHHGRKHEDAHADKEQQATNLHTKTLSLSIVANGIKQL